MLTAAVLTLGAQSTVSAAVPDTDRDGLPDAWEIQYHLNPNLRDSDADGIRDGAEDPDADNLSNLGELQLGTNPYLFDTDGDGTSDGAGDADGDGRSNAAEQDQRAVPSTLKPTLQGARKDRPLGYTDGCHSDTFDAHIHPCVYGYPTGARTIVMFGDSHAQQWMPALIAAANAHHWRAIAITKSACPGVHVKYQNPTYPGSEGSCSTWRLRAEKWLRDHPPSLIVISNTRGYRLIGTNGQVLSGASFETRWHNGLVQTLSNLPASSRKVVLGDTPHMSYDIPVCLGDNPNDVSACQAARATAWRTAHDQAETDAASARNATFVSLNGTICSYDPCPIVVNELLMWRDPNHLTATYAAELAPAMFRLVANALNAPHSTAGATDPGRDTEPRPRPPLLQGGP